MGHLFGIAFRNLLQQRKRTALVAGGIAFVCALTTGILGAMSSLESNVHRVTTRLIGGHLTVGGMFKPSVGRAVPVLVRSNEVKALVEQALPNAMYVAGRVVSDVRVSSSTASLNAETSVIGVEAKEELSLLGSMTLVEGSAQALLDGSGGALLFEPQANRLGVHVGDLITLVGKTTQGVNNALDVEVKAIAQNGGGAVRLSQVVFVPRTLMRQLLGLHPDAVSLFQVHFSDDTGNATVQEAQATLRRTLEAAQYTFARGAGGGELSNWKGIREQAELEAWVGQRVFVASWEEENPGLKEFLSVVNALIRLVIVVLMAIVCVGLLSMLWVSVRERTREIGTLRAIGMGRWEVMRMFLIEGSLLGLAAATFGALLGIGGSALLQRLGIPISGGMQMYFAMGDRLTFEFATASVVQLVTTVTLCTTLFSFPPAMLAAAQPPLLSINHTR